MKIIEIWRFMGNIREVLANNLKENRARLGLTQAELAEKAGVSTTYITMIERKRHFPTPDTLDSIARALNMDTSDLFVTPVSPKAVLDKVEKDVVAAIEKTVDEAVQKAIVKNFRGLLGKQQARKGKK